MLKERTQPFRALHGGAQRIAATVMAGGGNRFGVGVGRRVGVSDGT